MTGKGQPLAPWDRPGGGRAPDDFGGAEVEVSIDLTRRNAARATPAPPQATPEPSPKPSEADPVSPPADPSSDAFWAAPGSSDSMRAVAGPDDFLTPLAEESFDPATGWDFPSVSDADLPSTAAEGPADRPEPAAPAAAWLDPEPPAAALDTAELPHPTGPAPRLHDPFSKAIDVAEQAAIAKWHKEAAAAKAEAASPDPDRSEDLAAVSFDPDGFFSVADIAAPRMDTVSDTAAPSGNPFPESASYEFELDEDESSAVQQVQASGEFEFVVDATAPGLGQDIFSQAQLPSLPPDLALLPVDQAIVKAQELFRSDEAAMGMALLEAARMQAPEDSRVATWLEFGERRLMARYCPSARMESTPRLLHSRDKLLPVTGGDQRVLVEAIDGQSTVAELRARLSQVPVVGFWKDLGKLAQRGWLTWS